MDIEKSYIEISDFFDIWVRFMEIQTRRLETRDSNINGLRSLIISPPTDPGIKILTGANLAGETYLMCFSSELEKKAKTYMIQQRITGLKTIVNSYFAIPFEDNFFDLIFANCFFDFCQEYDIDRLVREIRRVLNSGGRLFSVHMDSPSTLASRIWVGLSGIFSSLSRGCHPVEIRPALVRQEFRIRKDCSFRRFGFPLKYLIAEKL